MKAVIIVLVVIVVLALLVIGGFMYFMSRGAKLEDFEHLREPRITDMPDQKVIEIEISGDPNQAAGDAFKALFSTYYNAEGVDKGGKPPAPMARWKRDFAGPKSEWTGKYALAVPEGVEKLPEVDSEGGPAPELATWEYGEVAEILHVGSYDSEKETIDRLLAFVDESGYRPSGDHEEVYLKGPGMFGAGNPDKYLTLIRYPVEEKPAAKSAPEDGAKSD